MIQRGTAHASNGHYWSYVCDRGERGLKYRKPQWYKCDDTNVEKGNFTRKQLIL